MRVGEFRKLNTLILSETQITDQGLDKLTTLSELRQLTVERTRVTSAGVAKLKEALPQCQIFAAESPERNLALWALGKGGRVAVVAAGSQVVVDVKEPSNLPQAPFHVQGLAFEERAFADGEIPYYIQSPRLETISLQRCKISEPAFRSIVERVPTLKRLILSNTSVGDAGVTRIKRLTGLTDVSLIEAGITDTGAANLAELKNLKRLELTGNRGITDAGLEPLRSLTKLRMLLLEKTSVTAAGVGALKAALPDCEIVASTDPERKRAE
jgi:hypothetical protein